MRLLNMTLGEGGKFFLLTDSGSLIPLAEVSETAGIKLLKCGDITSSGTVKGSVFTGKINCWKSNEVVLGANTTSTSIHINYSGTVREITSYLFDNGLGDMGRANIYCRNLYTDSPIGLAYGGTGATTASGALANLGIETGTWTPKLIDRTTGGSVSYTYKARTGAYVKIGRLVYVTAYISGVSGLAPMTNSQRAGVGILPFAANNDSSYALSIGSYYDLFSSHPDTDPVTAFVSAGYTQIGFMHTRGGNSARFAQEHNNGVLVVSGCYLTDV